MNKRYLLALPNPYGREVRYFARSVSYITSPGHGSFLHSKVTATRHTYTEALEQQLFLRISNWNLDIVLDLPTGRLV